MRGPRGHRAWTVEQCVRRCRLCRCVIPLIHSAICDTVSATSTALQLSICCDQHAPRHQSISAHDLPFSNEVDKREWQWTNDTVHLCSSATDGEGAGKCAASALPAPGAPSASHRCSCQQLQPCTGHSRLTAALFHLSP